MSDIPPPPAGFDLDVPPSKRPPPPAGFTLSSPPPPPDKPKPPKYGQRVGAAYKKFGEELGTGPGAITKGVGAAVDVAGEIIGGPVADIAGAATSVITQRPEWGKKVSGAIQGALEPTAPTARALSDFVATAAEPVAKLLNIPTEKLEKSGHPILAQLYQAAVDLSGTKIAGDTVKGFKRIGKAATAPRELTASEKMAKLAGKDTTYSEVVEAAEGRAAIAQQEVEKYRPVRDPATGKFSMKGPSLAQAMEKADKAKIAYEALKDDSNFRKLTSQDLDDVKAIKDSIKNMGPYAGTFTDEAIRRMGAGKTGEFDAVRFVRKFNQMNSETKWAVFGEVKGSQYLRDMNSLLDSIQRISDRAKKGTIHLPPGMHHLDFTRTDIILASITASLGRHIGVPHMIGFGVGLWMGKPIQQVFGNPAMVHRMRNLANTMAETAAEGGRMSFGMSVLGEQAGKDPQDDAQAEPYDKRHGLIQR